MSRQNNSTKLEHIKGRYGILIAFVAGISGTIGVPYLCNKEKKADTFNGQKIEVANNQNSPVANEVGTQNNYYTVRQEDTIKPQKKAAQQSAAPNKGTAIPPATQGKSVPSSSGGIYAPNANIVTQNQTGGSNTVIVADSYEKKLEALKTTVPELSYHLYMRDSALMADVEMKNDVPTAFHVTMRDYGGLPYAFNFPDNTLYPGRQRKYTLKIHSFYDRVPVYKIRISVNVRSIYYDEMKNKALWTKKVRIYLVDLNKQTLTLTDERITDDPNDPAKMPWTVL
jgi:hypothetical protein